MCNGNLKLLMTTRRCVMGISSCLMTTKRCVTGISSCSTRAERCATGISSCRSSGMTPSLARFVSWHTKLSTKSKFPTFIRICRDAGTCFSGLTLLYFDVPALHHAEIILRINHAKTIAFWITSDSGRFMHPVFVSPC